MQVPDALQQSRRTCTCTEALVTFRYRMRRRYRHRGLACLDKRRRIGGTGTVLVVLLTFVYLLCTIVRASGVRRM